MAFFAPPTTALSVCSAFSARALPLKALTDYVFKRIKQSFAQAVIVCGSVLLLGLPISASAAQHKLMLSTKQQQKAQPKTIKVTKSVKNSRPKAAMMAASNKAALNKTPLSKTALNKAKLKGLSSRNSIGSIAAQRLSAKNNYARPLAKQKRGAIGKKQMMLRGKRYKVVKYYAPPPPSVGAMSGLHHTPDPLELKSSVALVVDATSGRVLYEKNAHTALPIASITKLMAGLVVIESQQDLNEVLTVNSEDANLEQRVRSHLKQDMQMSRRDALQLALMSSENRAANMLSRHYPGGKQAFVDAMNRKAKQIGMNSSFFVEGTGLASANVASASDLVKLVQAAGRHSILRELSTQSHYTVNFLNGGTRDFHTTNRLIAHPGWEISLQKTGFINAAGQCLVMQTMVEGRPTIMVFLDSVGKLSRLGDAGRVRDWLTGQHAGGVAGQRPLASTGAAYKAPASDVTYLSATNREAPGTLAAEFAPKTPTLKYEQKSEPTRDRRLSYSVNQGSMSWTEKSTQQ